MDMPATIQISAELLEELDKRKASKSEPVEEVIWDLLEESKELNAKTNSEIEEARKRLREGKGIPWSELKKELGL